MASSIWLRFEGFIPREISENLQKKVGFGGEKSNSKKVVGFTFGLPWFVGLAVALNIFNFFSKDLVYVLGGFAAGTVGTFVSLLFLIDYYALKRARRIEKSLPDALELIATNINSGLTVENALIDSARPEFEELSVLLKRAAKEMFSGKSLDRALRGIADTIDSSILKKTIWLITEGIRKGGTLGNLLLRISKDLREEEALKDEINANISMYIILILIASIIGSPLLFGAGTMVSGMITKQAHFGTTVSNNAISGMPLGGILNPVEKKDSINFESIRLFAVLSIALTSFFASLLIGIIKYNSETAGLRYFIPILIVSIVLYFVVLFLFQGILGPSAVIS